MSASSFLTFLFYWLWSKLLFWDTLHYGNNSEVLSKYTRKNVTTSQQDVFATCLWQACQQVVTMLLFYQVVTRLSLTTCWKIVQLQNDDKLLVQLVTSLELCSLSLNYKSVELNNLVASCQQGVHNLSTSWEQAVRTHPDDKLLEQHCYKSAAGLLQLVRFYVCIPQIVSSMRLPFSLELGSTGHTTKQ
jgi:hypothetical protein